MNSQPKYKLVIIDDEQDVRLRLKHLVENANGNFRVVGLYENGIEAYDGVLSVVPELIITDIKIPYVDGLETIKRIKEVLPLVKSVVITGFDEYDYAKQAANLGVLGFINKPISQSDVEIILEKAAAELDNEFSVSENIKQLETFRQKTMPIICENDLCRLITMSALSDSFAKKLQNDGIDLSYDYMMLGVFDFDDDSIEFEQYDIIFTSIKKEFETEASGPKVFANVFMKSEKLYVLLKSDKKFKLSDVENSFLALIEKTKRRFGSSLKTGISYVSEAPHNYKQMSFAATKALEYRNVISGNPVFLFSDVQWPLSLSPGIDENMYRDLSFLVKFKSEEDGLKKLYELKQKIAGGNYSTSSYYYFVINILNSIVSSCSNTEQLLSSGDDGEDIYRKIFSIKNFDEMFAYLEGLIRSVRRINKLALKESLDSNLHKILEYIQINYTNPDLCLEMLSEQTNLSASYINTLLKKENTSFVKFTTGLRIKKAIDLLAGGSCKIVEISEMVGYSDPYYFSHCFKKYTGMSPKEYRANENANANK